MMFRSLLMLSGSMVALQAALSSLAKELAAGETQALAFDFTDDFWQADTGHYGSAWVKDGGTPANNYNSHPYGLLTYTSPSAKMTLGPSGTLRFGAHNLYLNSASPANQSVTVVSGATYSVDITGSVSVTASGAATGTWTAGSNTFTAATTTLTLGSTSGTGTVVVRRTPSDSTYLATAGSARYALPYEWDSAGNLLGILAEAARTNLCLRSQQLSDAAWGSDTYVTENAAVAPDGTTTAARVHNTGVVDNLAQTISVTAGTTYTFSFWAKNNGGTEAKYRVYNLTAGADIVGVTSYFSSINSSTWTRLSYTFTAPAGCTQAIVYVAASNDTNTDIYAWGAQVEAGSFPTSYIPTLDSTVTRAADSGLTLVTSAFPHSATVNSAMIRYRPLGVASAMVALRWDDGTSNEVVSLGHSAAAALGLTVTDGGAAQTAPLTDGTATANTWEKIACSWKANDFLFSDNGAAAVADTSGTLPTVTSLDIGPTLSGHISHILVIPVEKTGAEVATMATP